MKKATPIPADLGLRPHKGVCHLCRGQRSCGYSGYWQKNLQPCWVHRSPEWDTHSDIVYNNLKRKIAYAQGAHCV